MRIKQYGWHWGSVVYQTSEHAALCFYGLHLGWLNLGKFYMRHVDAQCDPAWLPESNWKLLRNP